jgi:protein O-GlcNAc transferase
MKWRLFLFVQVCLFGAGVAARAQDNANSDFEVICRRAAAALAAHPDEAARLYRQALGLRPDWAEGWFDLGGAFYQAGRFPESKQAFEKAASLAPENGAVWGFLGLCENQLKETAKALADIRRAESLGLPDEAHFMAQVRNCAADMCIRERKFSEAVQQLTPLVRAGIETPETIMALGSSGLGLVYEARDVPGPKRPMVQAAGRAMSAMISDRSDAADLFRKLTADYGGQPGVYYLAGMYWLERDPQKARGEFENQLKVSPANVPARLQMAALDLKGGNAPEALVLGKQALQLEPDNPLAHAVVGRAYEYSKEYAKAAVELEQASKLAPENAQLHFSLSRTYSRLGRRAAAEAQMAEFERLKNAGSVEQGGAQ